MSCHVLLHFKGAASGYMGSLVRMAASAEEIEDRILAAVEKGASFSLTDEKTRRRVVVHLPCFAFAEIDELPHA